MIYFKRHFIYLTSIAALIVIFLSEVIIIKQQFAEISKNIQINKFILNDFQSQLNKLDQEIKVLHKPLDLTAINQELAALTTKIEQFKTSEENELSRFLADTRSALIQKLEGIQLVLNSLDKKQNPIHYLPASSLPFQLLSIDSIQQVNIASVTYNYHTMPLEKNDALAGWTVVQIDFGKQCAEFENKDKERVVVKLDEGEQHV